MFEEQETRYYGITKCRDENGWYLMEHRGGTEKIMDHEPTEADIEIYVDECLDNFGY